MTVVHEICKANTIPAKGDTTSRTKCELLQWYLDLTSLSWPEAVFCYPRTSSRSKKSYTASFRFTSDENVLTSNSKETWHRHQHSEGRGGKGRKYCHVYWLNYSYLVLSTIRDRSQFPYSFRTQRMGFLRNSVCAAEKSRNRKFHNGSQILAAP